MSKNLKQIADTNHTLGRSQFINTQYTIITPVQILPGKSIRIPVWINQAQNLGIEVILIQDAKSKPDVDYFKELIRGWDQIGSFKSLKFFSGDFGNPGSARNFGIDQATGDWIVFWDSDDEPSVDALLSVLKAAENKSSQIAISSFTTCSEISGDAESRTFVPHKSNLIRNLTDYPGIWRFAFKRDVIGEKRFPASKMGEDQAFLSSLGIFDYKIHISDEVTYKYYFGNASHLVSQKHARQEILISINFIIENLTTQTGLNLELKKTLLTKQLLTSLKLGSYKTKLIAFQILFRLLFQDKSFAKIVIHLIRKS